jgi:hypothetical protein
MKRKINLLLALVILGLLSCQKDVNRVSDNEDITIKSESEQKAYAREHLIKVCAEAAKAMKNPLFADFVFNEAFKKFDGDNNVLIKALLANPVFGNAIRSEKLTDALNAFKNIGGHNYYPQIYIPGLDEKMISKNTGREEINTDTIYVIYEGEDEVQAYPGYWLDDNDSLVLANIDVDEEYASTHIVIVISLNERVSDDGIPEFPIETAPEGTNIIRNFKIGNMTVKEHKESWVAGGSDVAIRAWLWTWNGRLDGNPNGAEVDYFSLRSTNDLRGILIRRFTRKEVNKKTEVYLNYPMQTDWNVNNYFQHPIIFGYVIFERDNWPVGTKTTAVLLPSPANNYRYFTFRSADSEYSKGAIFGNMSGLSGYFPPHPYGDLATFLVDNSGIKFNTVEY